MAGLRPLPSRAKPQSSWGHPVASRAGIAVVLAEAGAVGVNLSPELATAGRAMDLVAQLNALGRLENL